MPLVDNPARWPEHFLSCHGPRLRYIRACICDTSPLRPIGILWAAVRSMFMLRSVCRQATLSKTYKRLQKVNLNVAGHYFHVGSHCFVKLSDLLHVCFLAHRPLLSFFLYLLHISPCPQQARHVSLQIDQPTFHQRQFPWRNAGWVD
jgi:hypothetical protein